MTNDETNLRMIQWNSRSLYPKLTRSKNYLYETKPHICCISETWLKKEKEPLFINYSAYYSHRSNKEGGGLAILTRKDIKHIPIDLKPYSGGKLEVQAITVNCELKKIDIMNIYNPNEVVKKAEFIHYFHQLENQSVITGDFNAHHSWWGDVPKNDHTGSNLFDSIYSFPDLTLLTPWGLKTYLHTQTMKSSTLDLCFLSGDLKDSASLDISECDMGSDHETIEIKLSFKPVIEKLKTRPKWKFVDGKWETWRQNLPVLDPFQNFENSYNELHTNLIETSKEIFGQTKGEYNPKYNKPWWNEDCDKVTDIKLKAKRKLQHHPSIENLIHFKKAEAIVRKTVKAAKKDSFEKYCNSINSFSPITQVWKKVNSFRSMKGNEKTNLTSQDGKLISDPKEKSKILADSFEENLNINHSELEKNIDSEAYKTSEITGEDLEYNQNFTMYELRNALRSLKNTSQGHDSIHNLMLKNMREDYQKQSLKIINHSFTFS